MLKPNSYRGGKNPLWFLMLFMGTPIFLHVLLLQSIGADSLVFDGILIWSIIGSLILLEKVHLTLPATPRSAWISLMLVGLLGIGSLWVNQELFLRAYPLIVVAILAMSIGGKSGLRQATPLLILCLLMLPTRSMLASQTFLAEPTAQFIHNVLSILGMANDRQHASLTMGQHLIRIIPECASVGSMRRMLFLGLWIALIQPVPFIKALWIPLLTCLYAFIANGIRVTALVALKATEHQGAFHFWHEGLGAKILPVVVLVPLLITYWLILKNQRSSSIT